MKDMIAAAVSGLCVLHCLLTPLLLLLGGVGVLETVLGTVLGTALSSDWVHYVLLVPVIILLAWSLPAARCQHQDPMPLRIAGTGLALLLVSLLVPAALEPWLAASGGLLLMGAHLLNRNLLHRLSEAVGPQVASHHTQR